MVKVSAAAKLLAFEAAAKRAEELAGHSEITSGTLTGMFLSCRWPIDTGEHTGSFTLSVFHGEFEAERSSIVGLSVHEVGIFERYAPVVPETARQVIAAYDEELARVLGEHPEWLTGEPEPERDGIPF